MSTTRTYLEILKKIMRYRPLKQDLYVWPVLKELSYIFNSIPVLHKDSPCGEGEGPCSSDQDCQVREREREREMKKEVYICMGYRCI